MNLIPTESHFHENPFYFLGLQKIVRMFPIDDSFRSIGSGLTYGGQSYLRLLQILFFNNGQVDSGIISAKDTALKA
jgi:hypothetical protein